MPGEHREVAVNSVGRPGATVEALSVPSWLQYRRQDTGHSEAPSTEGLASLCPSEPSFTIPEPF